MERKDEALTILTTLHVAFSNALEIIAPVSNKTLLMEVRNLFFK